MKDRSKIGLKKKKFTKKPKNNFTCKEENFSLIEL